MVQGDAYHRLCPTISICFVNGRLFPDRLSHHRRFRLLDTEGLLLLTDQLEIHVLEIPNFERPLADLREPLDFWLYFLKNGEELDADALPEPLNREEVRRAMTESEQHLAEAEQCRTAAEQRLAVVAGERDAVRQAAKSSLIRQIQLYERLLGRDVMDLADLQQHDEETLCAMADCCERELARLR